MNLGSTTFGRGTEEFFEFESHLDGRTDFVINTSSAKKVDEVGMEVENSPPTDEIQRMPEDYYNEVDSFLCRPAPQFGEGTLRHLNVSNNAKSSAVNNLLATTMSKRKVGGATSSSIAAAAKAKVNSQPQRRKFGAPMAMPAALSIDERLLREAFAYTDKLIQEDEEDEEEVKTKGPRNSLASDHSSRGLLEERRGLLPTSAPSRINAAYAESKPTR